MELLLLQAAFIWGEIKVICEICSKKAYYKDKVTMRKGNGVKTFYYCKQHKDEFLEFGILEPEEVEKL